MAVSRNHTSQPGARPFRASRKTPTGRWRIVATRQRFSDADEHNAVARFRQWERENAPEQEVFLSLHKSIDPYECAEAADRLDADHVSSLLQIEHDDGFEEIGFSVDVDALWRYVRKRLLDDPIDVARKTGIPQLANLRSFDLPKDGVPVAAVRAAYLAHSHAGAVAKKRALEPFDRLVEFAEAETLGDLTDEKLVAFRNAVVNHSGMKSSGTISGYFSRLRGVLRLAARDDLDAAQIESTVGRLKAKLYSPPGNVSDDPRPISREDFHALLDAAKLTKIPDVWRAMLLMGLNAALYMEDLCDLRWESIDFGRGAFITRRKKKGQCLRAAMLWDETIAALKGLPRNAGEFVFVSPTGTRYSRNAKINDFADTLRKKAIVNPAVTWSHIRDGAYTAAAHASGVDEKFARLLAGHRSHGLQDKYVRRNPEIVKCACDAVYEHYFRSPES